MIPLNRFLFLFTLQTFQEEVHDEVHRIERSCLEMNCLEIASRSLQLVRNNSLADPQIYLQSDPGVQFDTPPTKISTEISERPLKSGGDYWNYWKRPQSDLDQYAPCPNQEHWILCESL